MAAPSASVSALCLSFSLSGSVFAFASLHCLCLLLQSLLLNMSKQNKQFFHNYAQVCAPAQVLLSRSQLFISTRSPAEAEAEAEPESESGAGAAPALSATQLIFPPSTWLESYYFYDN